MAKRRSVEKQAPKPPTEVWDQFCEEAHQMSSYHRELLERYDRGGHKEAGCFYCMKIFHPSEIKEWTDNEQTAFCPKCHIDAVLPQTIAFPLSKPFLRRMYAYWFERTIPWEDLKKELGL